jgi:hypothetical protein
VAWLSVKRRAVVIVVEERRNVLSTVIEGGSNIGSATLMSIIVNIDDFHGCDQNRIQYR